MLISHCKSQLSIPVDHLVIAVVLLGNLKEVMATITEEKPAPMEKKNENGTAGEPTIKYRGWKAMPYVIGNETFEKLGTIGTAANLLVYLTTVLHMKNVTAATLLNVFNGTTNLAPVLGAFLADTYLGRYMTLGIASIASLLGMFIITLTAAISKLHPPNCEQGQGQSCVELMPWQFAVLLSAFGFLVIGAGGIRPCNLAFGADQFNPNTESGRRGISSFFNWYYVTYTSAMMVCSTVIIYIQSDVSWSLGLAIPTVLMLFSCVFFFLGSRIYVKVRPEGSPFTSIAQVLVAAFMKRGLKLPDDPQNSLFNPPQTCSVNAYIPHTNQFRLLDKASIITVEEDIKSHGAIVDPWRLCSIQQVEEVKCILRIIPIWISGIIYYIATVQQSTYVVFEALQSDRHIGHSQFQIPAGSFGVFSLLALTIWIPIYDRLVVPLFRKLTKKEGGITLLQRMGVGMILSILTMIISGLVEMRRKSYAFHQPTIGTTMSGSAISSMSSLWLIPELTLMGLSEAFNIIGQVEFYYKQFPENMRSVAGSMFFCSIACSNYLSGLMITTVHKATEGNGKGSWLSEDLNKGRLENFYFLIVILGLLNFIYFIICAKWYRYKGSYGDHEFALEEGRSNKM